MVFYPHHPRHHFSGIQETQGTETLGALINKRPCWTRSPAKETGMGALGLAGWKILEAARNKCSGQDSWKKKLQMMSNDDVSFAENGITL